MKRLFLILVLGLCFSGLRAFADFDPDDTKNSQELYEISADVLEVLVKKYKGDPAKMNEVLLRAQKDPEGFAKTEFTSEQLEKVKALSKRAPAKTNEKP